MKETGNNLADLILLLQEIENKTYDSELGEGEVFNSRKDIITL